VELREANREETMKEQKQKRSNKSAKPAGVKKKPRSTGIASSNQTSSDSNRLSAKLKSLLPDLEALYKDIHSHPELSMQETRTAGIAAKRLKAAGYEVTSGIGKPVSWVCCEMAMARR
jgi:hypothetical protein